MKISIQKFEKMYSTKELFTLGEDMPQINIKDDEVTNDKDYYVHIVLPIPSKLGKIEIDFKDYEKIKKLKKEKIFFCYKGLESIYTELNSEKEKKSRDFVIVYKSKEKKEKKIKYDWYRLCIKYTTDNEAQAILVESNDLGRLEPETIRGTVTTPRKRQAIEKKE